MKKSVLAASIAVAMGAASAQIVEHNRSNSQSRETQNSTGNEFSASKTIPVGALFFPKLADYERHIWQSVNLENAKRNFNEIRNDLTTAQMNYLQNKMQEGKMSNLDDRIIIMPCDVFSTTGRVVWSHNQTYGTMNYTNGVISFNEPLVIIGDGDIATSNPTSISMFGYPVFAAEHIRCSKFYALLIDSAIEKLLKKGAKVNNRTISMRNLESESEKALWDSFYTLKGFNRYDALSQNPQCSLPSGEGMRQGGVKDYRCGDWVVSQSPLRVVKSGITILDQNTINGRTWQFTETTTSSNSTTNKRNSTRGTSQKANVAN